MAKRETGADAGRRTQEHPASHGGGWRSVQRTHAQRIHDGILDGCMAYASDLEASLIAARMRTYVAQRQTLPAIAASMSASLGRFVLGEQRGRGHHLAGLAIAALGHVEFLPRGLHRRGFLRREALDGGDLHAGFECRQRDRARAGGLAVEYTVHAPHSAMPQPYLVPVRFRLSRRIHRSGVSPATLAAMSTRSLLTKMVGMNVLRDGGGSKQS